MARHSIHRARRGYVLLLTLTLLPVAAAVLMGVCRWSLERAAAARRAPHELQGKWGTLSIQASVVPCANLILEQAEADAKVPVVTQQMTLTLGLETFDLVFTDEQAKVNVNTVLVLRGPDAVRDLARRLSENSPSTGKLTVALRPTPIDAKPIDGTPTAPDRSVIGPTDTGTNAVPGHTPGAGTGLARTVPLVGFGSYGQIFDQPDPAALLGTGEGAIKGRAPIELFTCWGSGQINFRRASLEALQEACDPVLGPSQVAKLIDLRTQQPGLTAFAALNTLGLSKEDRTAAGSLLTDRSGCFGVWIIWRESSASSGTPGFRNENYGQAGMRGELRGDTRGRGHYHLMVTGAGGTGAPPLAQLIW